MRAVRVVNVTRGVVLGTRVRVADRWWQRLRGLHGMERLAEGEGMLLSPCASVHTLGMRFPLDVAFLERSGQVVALYPALSPNRGTPWNRGARFALELREGALADTRVGDRLEWSDAGE